MKYSAFLLIAFLVTTQLRAQKMKFGVVSISTTKEIRLTGEFNNEPVRIAIANYSGFDLTNVVNKLHRKVFGRYKGILRAKGHQFIPEAALLGTDGFDQIGRGRFIEGKKYQQAYPGYPFISGRDPSVLMEAYKFVKQHGGNAAVRVFMRFTLEEDESLDDIDIEGVINASLTFGAYDEEGKLIFGLSASGVSREKVTALSRGIDAEPLQRMCEEAADEAMGNLFRSGIFQGTRKMDRKIKKYLKRW